MRQARLVSVSCHSDLPSTVGTAEKVEANRSIVLECLERASRFQPDCVCFPEIVLQAGAGAFTELLSFAETIPGKTSDLVAERARAMSAYVVFCTLEAGTGDDTGHVFNSAVLLGRDGEIVGRYRKYHATGYEIEDGATPGTDVPVWQTDLGRLGCAICFDLKFPVVGLELSRGRAQVVFWPSMFNGGRRMSAWAMDYGFYLVRCTSRHGGVIDPTGNMIATEGPEVSLRNGSGKAWFTFAKINTDRKTYHLDFHGEKLQALAAKYADGVDIHYMTDEATFNLTSNLPDRSVEDLEQEFELQDLRSYLDEAARIRDRALAGKTS